MTFKLQTQAQFLNLHCSVGLTDWDMDQELNLVTTTDQFCHDDKPDQYLAYRPSARASEKDEFIWYDKTSADRQIAQNDHAEEIQKPLTSCPQATIQNMFSPQRERMHVLSSPSGHMNEGSTYQTTHRKRKGRPIKVWDDRTLKPGCWPRPPVNYCILIALALKSSHNGSLKVQQIYNFTRKHFPFFQTAPDGWKNTIRHNLCFNSSFRKIYNQMCRDGKRKSCFWHLTLDGHCRLRDEIRMLTGDSLKLLERSMSCPDIISKLLGE
ncbi:forkhead box protein R1 isoform X2 [Corythoichthys intestinalis]|uniref:forkhead box protein R1 isoform X2 n=1 Tax=Corythoichthys intestinalis TaxID=161448 RepID=UPI0025A5F687|nr:forkhead box protein R1 isoform X2 [Corythoichthys intestinalis]